MKKILFLSTIFFFMNNAFSQELLIEANNDFAFKIYNATKPDYENFFISPFSLNIALSIVNEGAKTTTRKEIDSLLSLKSTSNIAFNYRKFIQNTINLNDLDFQRCIEWSGENSSKNELFLANSLWINDAIDIETNFIENSKEYYNSDIFSFNKNNKDSINKQLNNWVSNKTNNNISEIKGLNEDIMLSIVNAVYFMGEWNIPFDKKKTKNRKFRSIDRKRKDLEFMRNRTHYRYYEDTDIKAIYLPYICNQFSMVVILPQKRYGILEIEKKMNKTYFQKIDSLSTIHEVILTFPKFKIESEIYPKEEIIKLGYPIMFSDEADFTRISKADSLKIGEIIHKTYIEIDEMKTEAAAVTKVDMIIVGYGGGSLPPPPPKIFNANHPFIFFIRDNRTNAILFTGRFVK